MKLLKQISYFGLFTLLMACPNDDMEDDILMVQPVTYNLLSFEFTQETANNEDALAYEIEFINPNAFAVSGTPRVTVTDGGGGGTVSYIPNAQCQSIPANASCTLTYDVVDDTPGLFPAEPIQFVSAEYVLDE